MSKRFEAGIDYARLKRHYDADDSSALFNPATGALLFNGMAFTTNVDYYVVGTHAYLQDSTVANVEHGWTTFTHGQPVGPTFLQAILTALGVSWPNIVPAFEAKDLLFYATEDCYIQFESRNRVRHYIPADTYMRFHRRCLIFFVEGTVAGTLYFWLEG